MSNSYISHVTPNGMKLLEAVKTAILKILRCGLYSTHKNANYCWGRGFHLFYNGLSHFAHET